MPNLTDGAPKQTAMIYFLTIGLCLAGIFVCLYQGPHLAPSTSSTLTQAASHPASQVASVNSSLGALLAHNASDALSRLFLQITLIIAATWFIGWLFHHVGQPTVIGEMVAGILLGPSLFGLIAPRAYHFVFDPVSLTSLNLLSQIGVCLFMFAVGMELDLSQLRHRAERFLVIGHGSIAIPYLFGVIVAVPLYRHYANPGASFSAFALFMGISMSITAFPVLVRILKDRNLFKTSLGNMATLCAAIGDVTAWCILAFVIAVAAASSMEAAALRLGLVGVYAGVMLVVLRPILARVLRHSLRDEVEPQKNALVLVLRVVLVSALSTEVIGIHALFGAFVAGIIMPAGGGFRRKLILRVEHFSSVLLLPIFFAFTGLRTQVGLLSSSRDWLVCLIIIGIATIGKLGGTALIARCFRNSWRESLALGALMNTRGLMELIALNIGYEMGILSMHIFAMLVLMAIVTTIMTGPLVSLFHKPGVAQARSS